MDELIYRFDGVSRRLIRETRRAIVFTDNNMVRLVIRIPRRVNDKDIRDFNYVIKFLIDEEYREKVPEVIEDEDGFRISTLISQDLTNSDGRLRFSFTGYKEGFRYSSTIATVDLKNTIAFEQRGDKTLMEEWLEEIREEIAKVKDLGQEEVGERIQAYLEENGLDMDYEILENKPRLEGITIQGDKGFNDYGLNEMTAEDIKKLF